MTVVVQVETNMMAIVIELPPSHRTWNAPILATTAAPHRTVGSVLDQTDHHLVILIHHLHPVIGLPVKQIAGLATLDHHQVNSPGLKAAELLEMPPHHQHHGGALVDKVLIRAAQCSKLPGQVSLRITVKMENIVNRRKAIIRQRMKMCKAYGNEGKAHHHHPHD